MFERILKCKIIIISYFKAGTLLPYSVLKAASLCKLVHNNGKHLREFVLLIHVVVRMPYEMFHILFVAKLII